MSKVRLTSNQYGKAENRLMRVYRDSDRHEIRDLNVTSQLWGDFETAHTEGNNEHVVATDTQKNTVFAKAKELGVSSPEQFLMGLADHFTSDFDWVTGGRWKPKNTAGTGSTITSTRSSSPHPRSAPSSSPGTAIRTR